MNYATLREKINYLEVAKLLYSYQLLKRHKKLGESFKVNNLIMEAFKDAYADVSFIVELKLDKGIHLVLKDTLLMMSESVYQRELAVFISLITATGTLATGRQESILRDLKFYKSIKYTLISGNEDFAFSKDHIKKIDLLIAVRMQVESWLDEFKKPRKVDFSALWAIKEAKNLPIAVRKKVIPSKDLITAKATLMSTYWAITGANATTGTAGTNYLNYATNINTRV